MIRNFCLAAAILSAAFHSAARGDDGIAAALQPFVDRHELAGAVALVATRDKILATHAVGFADIAADRPMRPDSLFWIASQSKPVTAAAFMILVDEGKVNLDDPVEKYLPEFKGQMVVREKDGAHVLLAKPAHPITLRNVLAHTSGLPFKTLVEEPTLDIYPLSARVRSYAMAPLDFEPDSKYQYSNAGINTAARVVEVVAKMPFEKFLDERLFGPLGMKETTFWPSAGQAARIAKAYKPGPNQKGLVETPIAQLFYPLTDRRERTPMPAGGLFSTAQDLAKFYQMLLNNGEAGGKRVLSPEAVKQLTTRQTPEGVKESYGLGFAVSPNTFGHGGAYSTLSEAYRKEGMILIWLVQHADFPGDGKNADAAFRNAVIKAYK